jgi:hypothetical protein
MPLVGIGTLPTPFSPAGVPLPPETGGGGTLACGWGVGGSPNSDKGHTLWYSLYVRTLWAGRNLRLLQLPIALTTEAELQNVGKFSTVYRNVYTKITRNTKYL